MKSIKSFALTIGTVAVGVALFVYFTEVDVVDSDAVTAPAVASTVKLPAANLSVTTQSVSTVSTPPAQTEQVDLSSVPGMNADVVTESYDLQTRIDQMQARREGQHFDQEAIKNAVQQRAAWEVDPAIADNLGLDDQERYDGREFIRFSPLKLESLMPGDEMEIPLAQQNATYQMVVDKVQVQANGNVSWYGHLKDFPMENQVSFTRGKDLTVGSIAVPDKQFTLQAQGGMGWVVNSYTLFKGKDEHLYPEDGGEHGGHQHSHQHDLDQES